MNNQGFRCCNQYGQLSRPAQYVCNNYGLIPNNAYCGMVNRNLNMAPGGDPAFSVQAPAYYSYDYFPYYNPYNVVYVNPFLLYDNGRW